jgi:hypothetical protein
MGVYLKDVLLREAEACVHITNRLYRQSSEMTPAVLTDGEGSGGTDRQPDRRRRWKILNKFAETFKKRAVKEDMDKTS